MDERFDLLLDLLKASLKKNGNKEITIFHLINMMEMVNKKSDEMDRTMDMMGSRDEWMWKD